MAGHIAESDSVEWCTPQWIIDGVKEAFGGVIDLDPCSNSSSIVGALNSYSLPNKNGLAEPWNGNNVFVNPPFGIVYNKVEYLGLTEYEITCITRKQYKLLEEEEQLDYIKSSISDWIKKCIDTSWGSPNRSLVALIPAHVDTKIWQQYIFKTHTKVCFLKGRVNYLRTDGKTGPAPMACALVLWTGNPDVKERFNEAFESRGYIIGE